MYQEIEKSKNTMVKRLRETENSERLDGKSLEIERNRICNEAVGMVRPRLERVTIPSGHSWGHADESRAFQPRRFVKRARRERERERRV